MLQIFFFRSHLLCLNLVERNHHSPSCSSKTSGNHLRFFPLPYFPDQITMDNRFSQTSSFAFIPLPLFISHLDHVTFQQSP